MLQCTYSHYFVRHCERYTLTENVPVLIVTTSQAYFSYIEGEKISGCVVENQVFWHTNSQFPALNFF